MKGNALCGKSCSSNIGRITRSQTVWTEGKLKTVEDVRDVIVNATTFYLSASVLWFVIWFVICVVLVGDNNDEKHL